MKLAIAADHAGYPLKQIIVDDLQGLGHAVEDLGTHDPDPQDDYPDFAIAVCEAIRANRAERGIVICGSGVGVVVAANKYPGIRAGICHESYSAHQGVEHDQMNVLCMGARIIGQALAREIVERFVSASFSGEERHERRLKKVREVEDRFLKA